LPAAGFPVLLSARTCHYHPHMSFDLYLVPASGFRGWTDEQWQAYFDTEPESENLGPARYVGTVGDAITYHLEGNRAGSKYPLLLGRTSGDVIGWYAEEIAPLRDEIHSIHERLAAIAVTPSTLAFDSDGRLQQLIEWMGQRYPTRPLSTLYDVFRHYIDVYERMVERARATGGGLWLSF
jgi:hypothetical protein